MNTVFRLVNPVYDMDTYIFKVSVFTKLNRNRIPHSVPRSAYSTSIDSPCECEHNHPDSLDARLFFTVVLAVAPAVTMDEASSLSTCR